MPTNIERFSTTETPLPLDYFKIQAVFASKLSRVGDIPLAEALLNYTTFYRRIGIENWGWNHNPSEPKWQRFEEIVEAGSDPAELAYSLYVMDFYKKEHVPTDSCFTYEYDEKENEVYIHFRNNFSGQSPLSKTNLPLRRDELEKIFKEVSVKHPDAKKVSGGSWIYSLETYRSLFPPEYIKNLEQVDRGFKGVGLWGQFLTSSGALNQRRAQTFLDAVESAKTEGELKAAFPMKFYETEAPIEAFYKHFGVQK